MLRRSTVAFALLAVSAIASGSAAAADDDLLDTLAQKGLLTPEEYTRLKLQAKSPPVTADESGFTLASAEKGFQLRLRLLAEFDGREFFNDDRAKSSTTAASGNGAGNTFTIRRARPILSGTLGKNFEFAFVPEFAGGSENTSTVSLLDVWGALKIDPALGIRVGKFTLPVVLEPGSNRHFNESPFPNYLAPNRDPGIEIGGSLARQIVEYRIGVFNGSADNATAVNNDGNSDKSVAGRLTLKPLATGSSAFKSLAVSVGASFGHEDGFATTAGVSSVSRRALFSYGSNIAVDGQRIRVSPGLTLYSGPYSAVAEYIVEKADYRRTSTSGTTTSVVPFEAESSAWRATFGYLLTGEDSTGAVKPRRPFQLGGEGWGAFELAAFASGIDFDDALFDPAQGALSETANARKATAWGLACNWYQTRNVSVRLDYEQTAFDNAYRRGGKPAADERAVSARFQLLY